MKKYPFKFLDSYDSGDTSIFFGRDEEINALYEMVFQSPILLLYGASGTGKTSLIQCGLASRFQSHDWQALTIRRGPNLNTAFDNALIAAAGNSAEEDESMAWLNNFMDSNTEEVAKATKPLTPLARKLKNIYLKSFRPLYLIFDQFEELFILGSKEEQRQFIETVKEILQMEQPVKMIISIREEYLGHLNEFEKAVPQLFRKKLRVEPMNLDKVQQVIVGATSYADSNISLKAGETDQIAEAIFNKIKGREKTLTIQLPYLQVFLDNFYLTLTKDEDRQADAIFDMETLNKMGDIGDVLSNFLEDQVFEINIKLGMRFPNVTIAVVWDILSPFATLEGTKEPMGKENLYKKTGVDKALIDQTVEAFIGSRILRYTQDTDKYEIAHDSLAKTIAEKRSEEQIAKLQIERLIKSQSSLKKENREPFSEKNLILIEGMMNKLTLTDEEKALIKQSQDKLKADKAKEKEEQEKENKRLLEKQRIQKRFIRSMVVALVLMVGLVWWALGEKAIATKAEQHADSLKVKAEQKTQEVIIQKEKFEKEHLMGVAKQLKADGEYFIPRNEKVLAKARFSAAYDSIAKYQDDELTKELKVLKDKYKK